MIGKSNTLVVQLYHKKEERTKMSSERKTIPKSIRIHAAHNNLIKNYAFYKFGLTVAGMLDAIAAGKLIVLDTMATSRLKEMLPDYYAILPKQPRLALDTPRKVFVMFLLPETVPKLKSITDRIRSKSYARMLEEIAEGSLSVVHAEVAHLVDYYARNK